MILPKVNMISKGFAHDFSSCAGHKPELFEWDFNNKTSNVSVYVDSDWRQAVQDSINGDTRHKCLWFLESPEFNGGSFDDFKNNVDLFNNTFKVIFTYSDEIAKLSNKCVQIWTTNSWIKEPKVYEKTKLVSMITSNKMFSHQQLERVTFAYNNLNNIDVFGRGFREIETKEEGLKDYMFSVCMENCTYDTYFTEKILDCFTTGTIPVYKGTRNICNIFDPNGIIFLDEIQDLSWLNPQLYFSKLEAVNRNFLTATQYILVDDLIFRDYLNKYL